MSETTIIVKDDGEFADEMSQIVAEEWAQDPARSYRHRLQVWRELLDTKLVPPDAFLRAFVIKPKRPVERDDGSMQRAVPFQMNTIQERVYAEIRKQLTERGYARIIIDKARQMGCSTLVGGLYWEEIVRTAGRDALLIADSDENTRVLFDEKIRALHEQVPEALRPKVKTLTGTGLVYKHKLKGSGKTLQSSIRVITAGGKKGSRSRTAHLVHFSEAAFFADAKPVFDATLQSVPDNAGIVIIESTANGTGNEYHRRWLQAIQGESEYVPLFFGWHEFPEYTRPFENDGEKEAFLAGLNSEEKRILGEFDVTPEQMNWRRHTMRNKCGGDLNMLKQEYPMTWEESFLATGTCRFNLYSIREARERAPTPIARGWVLEDAKTGQPRWSVRDDGDIRMFREPVPGHSYIIGADVGIGVEGGDPSAAVVRDRHSEELMAYYHGQLDSDDYSEVLSLLGTFYNDALLVPEANGVGHHVCMALGPKNLAYPNLYTRKKEAQKGRESKAQWGWQTVFSSREWLIEAIAQRLHEGAGEFFTEELGEMEHFVRQKSGKYEAEGGYTDDLVIADGIALYVNSVEPIPRGRATRKVQRARDNAIEWCDNLVRKSIRSKRRKRGGRLCPVFGSG